VTKTFKDLPVEELLDCGHKACQGCGAVVSMRFALKALGYGTNLIVPACCWTVLEGEYPWSVMRVPFLHTAFETAAAAGSGLRAAQRIRGIADETRVLSWAGDGGTFDIGLQSLSGAAERNEDIIYVCYDNEAYMNTGIQRSSATPKGAWTTTTPTRAPESGSKKDIVQIVAAHGIPYIATASAGYPDDFYNKMLKARDIRGTRFIHVLAPCPPGWKTAPSQTIILGKLVVQTRVFPLLEVEQGRWTLRKTPAKPKPVQEYLKLQGRFQHLSDEAIAEIQSHVDSRWRFLLGMEEMTKNATGRTGSP
jgi:pyruvate/2-oxoacid:ferredoxin oxidoreductase beta subunit